MIQNLRNIPCRPRSLAVDEVATQNLRPFWCNNQRERKLDINLGHAERNLCNKAKTSCRTVFSKSASGRGERACKGTNPLGTQKISIQRLRAWSTGRRGAAMPPHQRSSDLDLRLRTPPRADLSAREALEILMSGSLAEVTSSRERACFGMLASAYLSTYSCKH